MEFCILRVTCLVSDNEYLFLTDSGLILQNLTLQVEYLPKLYNGSVCKMLPVDMLYRDKTKYYI